MELVIRPARIGDVKGIWDLLHANTLAWPEERFTVELPKIWVMLQDSKMRGVLKGNFEVGELKVEWVAIHPLYPEQQLREAIIKGICAILGLDRSEAGKALIKYELALELG